MKQKNMIYFTQAAMIGAIYVVLTYVFAPISFGEIQIRIAEALTILPIFTPAAIPGLLVGCILGNIAGGALLPDIILGSLTTFIAAILSYWIGKKQPLLAPIPPIVCNMIVVPLLLRFAYGILLPLPLMMVSVGIGQAISCGGLGLSLYFLLRKHHSFLFPTS